MEVEEELRKIHGEVGLDEHELKFNEDSSVEVTLEESDLIEPAETVDQADQQQDENLFTYEYLLKDASNIKLPSSLWAVHKDPKRRFLVFSRLPATRMGRLIADKSVVFAESLIPSVFFREMKLKLPAGVPTQALDSLHQVSTYLHKIHRLAFCTGTGLRDPIRSMKCRIYVDMPSSVKRCTACNAQRQAVMFAVQQKKT